LYVFDSEYCIDGIYSIICGSEYGSCGTGGFVEVVVEGDETLCSFEQPTAPSSIREVRMEELFLFINSPILLLLG
jgi:hypothetical protein